MVFNNSRYMHINISVLMFGCCFIPAREYFTHMERHHYRRSAARFRRMQSTWAVFEQGGIFIVPQLLLWHWVLVFEASFTNCPVSSPFMTSKAYKVSILTRVPTVVFKIVLPVDINKNYVACWQNLSRK